MAQLTRASGRQKGAFCRLRDIRRRHRCRTAGVPPTRARWQRIALPVRSGGRRGRLQCKLWRQEPRKAKAARSRTEGRGPEKKRGDRTPRWSGDQGEGCRRGEEKTFEADGASISTSPRKSESPRDFGEGRRGSSGAMLATPRQWRRDHRADTVWPAMGLVDSVFPPDRRHTISGGGRPQWEAA